MKVKTFYDEGTISIIGNWLESDFVWKFKPRLRKFLIGQVLHTLIY